MDRSRPFTFSTVSVVVLAYNEAKNLPVTIDIILKTITKKFPVFEIIIVNDGSQDETGSVAESLSTQDPRLKVIHNHKNRGCGYSFWHGVQEAQYDYVWLLPGDGEIPQVSLETIVNEIGSTDMLIPYMTNANIRPLFRRFISKGYTCMVNTLFFKSLHYYNGPGVFPAEKLRKAPRIYSSGFAFMAPIIITLINQRVSWKEVGILLKQRDYGTPSFRNVLNIFGPLVSIVTFRLRPILKPESMHQNAEHFSK